MFQLIFKIALQVLAVSLAILITYLDYLWSDKRTRKFKVGRKVLFASSFIFLVGSVIATITDERNKRLELIESQELNKRLEQQIKRTQNPINEVSLTFYAKVNLQHPEFDTYRNRFENGLKELQKKGWSEAKKEGVHPLVFFSANDGEETNAIITLHKGSKYLPHREAEDVAYDAFNDVSLFIDIYKKPLNEEEIYENYVKRQHVIVVPPKGRKPDLAMHVTLAVEGNDRDSLPTLTFNYDMTSKQGKIYARDISISSASQTRSTELYSVSDIYGAQIILQIYSPETELDHFGINLSRIGFDFTPEKMKLYEQLSEAVFNREMMIGKRVYVGYFPQE